MGRHPLLVGTLIFIAALLIACGENKDPVNSTNQPPAKPTIDTSAGAPANGATDVALTAVLRWICTDADGDEITYSVYFGNSPPLPVVSASQTTKTFNPGTLEYSETYYWKIDATDTDEATSSSDVWSFTTMDEPAQETVSTPGVPSGPENGFENEDLDFSAGGAVSSFGDNLEYRFDWGDGSFSDWTTTSLQHSWSTAGTYEVKIQARCATHTTIESTWSAGLSVTITVWSGETVSTPDIPSGPSSGETNEGLGFYLSGAVSSEGHRVEYYVDWGDGDYHFWSISTYVVHVYDTPGTYDIRVRARCENHHLIWSVWVTKTVTITEASPETVSTPDISSGPSSGETDTNLDYTAGGAVSSDGHSVEYRFDWDDGSMSLWSTSTNGGHSWTTAGTYDIAVQARCQTHTSITSAWSNTKSITISDPPETISSPPDSIYGVFEGAINESYDYIVYHSSQTNLGDGIEGQFDWGDGTYSDWISSAPYSASHTYTTEGTYTVNYQARCATHTSITAEANPLLVTITETASETVEKPGFVNYSYSSKNPVVGDTKIYTAYSSTSSLGHDVETRFDWGDGTQSDWVAHLTSLSKTWNTVGTYQMTRQCRCATHPEIVSEWSDPTTINVLDYEAVLPPDAPSGPTTGIANESLRYYVTGAASSWGHETYMEYRYDWGDGSALTAWSETDTAQYHQFTAVGDYEVKAQARCIFPGHDAPESDWSAATIVSILEAITLNSSCYGPDNGAVNVSYEFYVNIEATSSEGHTIEYRFDFDDGTISDWSTSLTASHVFTAPGTYDVVYQARCVDDIAAISDWSYYNRIEITDAPEILTTPGIFTNYQNSYEVGESFYVSARGSESNHGDSLEYYIDYGDGTNSGWIGATWSIAFKWSVQPSHTYNAVGTYDITCQTRCVAHPSVISEWSTVHTIAALESFESLPAPTGPSTGTVGENLTYATDGTTSSEGHTLEYSFQYWGYSSMISQSDWSTSLTDDHVFSSTGSTYRVRVVARCATHPDAIVYSPFTGYITITQ